MCGVLKCVLWAEGSGLTSVLPDGRFICFWGSWLQVLCHVAFECGRATRAHSHPKSSGITDYARAALVGRDAEGMGAVCWDGMGVLGVPRGVMCNRNVGRV